MGMHKSGGTKARGRNNIMGSEAPISGNQGALPLEQRVDTNRPIGNGGGKNRGDRRDMSKAYTGNTPVRANHADVDGRPGERRASNPTPPKKG
jgi:hypothetical protein